MKKEKQMVTRNRMIKGSVMISLILMSIIASAQSVNIAPNAVASASTCNTGACSTLNDLNFGTCGTQQIWISTSTPPSTTPGVEWIQWDWPTPQTFDKLVIHHAQTGTRFMAGFTAQYWNGTTWITHATVSGLPDQCINTVTFTNAVSTAKFRITAFLMSGSQLSNPNFREIEIYNSHIFPQDCGVTSIDSPAVNTTPGQHLVSVKITNFGSDTLKSAKINWSINGVGQAQVPWTGSLIKNQASSSIPLTTYTFNNGSYNLRFWTSNPNNMLDSNKYNDTLKVTMTVCNLLSGTVVVDKYGNGNYLNLQDAVNALAYCGVNGPVTIQVRPATYTGRTVILPIPGASATNRITIDGLYADSTKIVYSTGSTGNSAVIALNGADYITIKNLRLENTNITYSCGVFFCNKAEYNIVENCIIDLGITSTSSSSVPIMGSGAEASPTTNGDMGNYNIIRNNRLIGGYYGIRLYPLSSTPYNLGTQIVGNTIEQFYYYGVYIYYIRNLLFQYNKIIKPRYAYAYGMYCYYNYNSIFDGNIINPGSYGMMMYYHQNTAPDSTIISNNIITNFMNGTYQTGIYLYSSYRAHVYNNSIWVDGTYSSTASYGCIYNYSTTGCVIRNNIFKATGNLNCYTSSGATMLPGTIDYNNYIPSSSASVAPGYSTLILWKSGDPTQNVNSYTQEPQFKAYTDLHLQSSSPLMLGKKISFPYDVDGDSRCQISSTIGADEYPYAALPPAAGFTTTDTNCSKSPVYFWNTASSNDVTKNSWFVNGILKSTALNFSYVPDTSGVDTIMLITANCFGADTFSRTITILQPIHTPNSDFVVSKNRVKIGEYVKLNDLSTDCPSTWEWKIIPDTTLDLVTGLNMPSYTFLNGTSRYSSNPEIQFNYSGFYDVTLNTSNAVGTGTSIQKKQYISVVFSGAMCIGSDVTNESEGFLYDNGGKTLNYTSNKLCTYTIHPCASTVSISFSKFNLTSGDYLRIYDGTDNKGTPLWNKKLYKYGMGNAIQASYPSQSDVFTAQSGAMYIEFETDATLTAEGFEALWTSTPGSFSPPVAGFTTADSNCNGSHVFFENTSQGNDNKYFWDFDNNGQYESSLENPYFIYTNDGNYNVRLAVVNCGGTDTAYKSLTIYTSQNKPTFDFEASNQRPNLAKEVVYISGFPLTDCIDTFNWIITPNSYKIVSGDLHSQTVGIVFNDSVCYNVTLISGYRGMLDTVYHACLVLPIEYCIPNFSYFTPDIGISRVTFAEIDQLSEPGMQPYEDFTNTKTALLEYGVTYHFTVSRTTDYNNIQRSIWIDYNIDGDFNDPGELVAYDTGSKTIDWSGTFIVPLSARLGLSRLRVGVAAVNQKFGPCSILNNGEYEDYSVLISKNITPPVISIIGSSVMHIQQCGTYTELGAISINQLGNSEPVQITGTVDPQITKTYYVKYNSVDVFGNAAVEKIRTVIVDPDSKVPEFMLNGKVHDSILVHSIYTDPLFVASDSCAGLESVKINSNLNIHVLGTYSINYTAYDYNGNNVTLSREIHVIDNIPPTIKVFDPDTILMEVNTALNPRVLSITDNYNTTFSIVTTGTFYQNFNTGLATSIGIYTIIYTVSDESGNQAVKKFWIKVTDQTNPSIILNGSRIISLCRYDTIDEKGWVAEDNIDPNPKVSRSGSYLSDYMVHFGVGTYEIKYTVTDYTGNYSSVSRLIYVSDKGACATSVRDAENSKFRIYPNPSNGLLNIYIDMPGKTETAVLVFDALGKVIVSRNIEGGRLTQIDLGNIAEGIYTVQFISDGLKSTQKVSVIH
jgi:PKD repeat protein